MHGQPSPDPHALPRGYKAPLTRPVPSYGPPRMLHRHEIKPLIPLGPYTTVTDQLTPHGGPSRAEHTREGGRPRRGSNPKG